MSFLQKLNDDLRSAMKGGQKERVEVLRFVLSGVQGAQKEKGVKQPGVALTDDEATTVLQKEAKRRKEAMELFKQGKRDDLVKKELPSLSFDSFEELFKNINISLSNTGDLSQIQINDKQIKLSDLQFLIDEYFRVLGMPISLDSIKYIHENKPFISKEIFLDTLAAARCLSKTYSAIRYIFEKNHSVINNSQVEDILLKELEYFDKTYSAFMELAQGTKSDNSAYVIGNVRKSIGNISKNDLRGCLNKLYKDGKTLKGYVVHRQFDVAYNKMRHFWCDSEIACRCYDIALFAFNGVRVSSRDFEMVSVVGNIKHEHKPTKEFEIIKIFKMLFLNKLYVKSKPFSAQDIMQKLPVETSTSEKDLSSKLLHLFPEGKVYFGVLERVEQNGDRTRDDLKKYKYRILSEGKNFILLSKNDIKKYSRVEFP